MSPRDPAALTRPRTIGSMMVGRLARRPEAWLRISATATAVALLAVSVPLGATVYRGALLVLFVGVLVQVSAVPIALIRPWIAAPLSVVGAVTIIGAAHGGGAPWPWSVTTMIAQGLVLALLGFRAPWPLGAGTLIVVLVFSGVVAALSGQTRDQQTVAIDLVVFTFIGGTALAAGIVSRQWQAIRRQLASERRLTEGERARRMLAEEKTRIARELHDVIAHSMSIITIQASSAPVRHPGTSDELRQEFDEIAESSRRALAEMRSLLSVLRDPDAPLPRIPTPRLSDIPRLVTQSQQSGLDVRLNGVDALTDDNVDEAVGVTGYRIVQEALSNIIRHAPGTQAEIRVGRGAEIDIVIANTPPPISPTTVRDDETERNSGNGLLGMRDRAAAVNGAVEYGPITTGGYEVHVMLPLRQAPPHAGETEQ